MKKLGGAGPSRVELSSQIIAVDKSVLRAINIGLCYRIRGSAPAFVQ